MQTLKIAYKNCNIFCRIVGKGQPVLLLHGFGEDGNVWNNQVKFLQNKFQLIVPDLPGSGTSELIEDMSIEGMATCINEILPKIIAKNVLLNGICIIGHSMGGYITLAIAEIFPSIVASFGLVHSSAFADTEEKKATRLKSIDFIKKNGAFEFFKNTIPNLFLQPEGNTHCTNLVEQSKHFTSEAVIAYTKAMINRPDRTAVLKTFASPILFIIGENDKAVPFADSLPQTHLPMQAHINILRKSAHMGMYEEEEKVNKVLMEFFNN